MKSTPPSLHSRLAQTKINLVPPSGSFSFQTRHRRHRRYRRYYKPLFREWVLKIKFEWKNILPWKLFSLLLQLRMKYFPPLPVQETYTAGELTWSIFQYSNNRLLKKAVTLEVGQTITTLGYWSRTNLFFPLCGWTWRTQNFKEPSKLNVPLASSQKDALHLSLSLPLSCLLYVSFSRLIASSELAETEQFISPKWTRVGGHGPLNGWLKPPPL